MKSEATGEIKSEGIIELPGATLSIRPQNAKVSLSILGFLIPFLPLPGEKTRPSENFRIHLQLDSSFENELWLNPAQVSIIVNSQEISPIKYLVVPGINYYGVTFAHSPSDASPGHRWLCDESFIEKHEMRSIQKSNPIQFVLKECLILEYPITTLSPKQDFKIIVDGLKQKDRIIQVPIIQFHRKFRMKYESHILQ